MAADFRDESAHPRRGRDPIGRFLWLGRVIDKARASRQGTIAEYIYPCPIDQGMLERWGISPAQFDEAIATNPTDDALVEWITTLVPMPAATAANEWLLANWLPNLERQDREEGAPGG